MPFITKQFKFCAAHKYWNENWSAENGNFRVNGDFVEWLPSQAGTWRVSAHAEGVETWLDLTVITGEISHVWIDAEHDILTADEETPLILQAEDSRVNRWPISAEWAVQEPEVSASLVSDIEGVRFVGGLAGTWNVTASHSSPNGTFSTYYPSKFVRGRVKLRDGSRLQFLVKKGKSISSMFFCLPMS